MPARNPFGLHTITPYLVVDDVSALIEFLRTVFGAELRGEINYRDDGSVKHTEAVIDGSVLMMAEPMEDIESMPSMLYIYVDDADATYKKALEAGATSVLEPANYPHGDRYGGVTDSNGNVWWVVTHIGRNEGVD